jgi:hypothetical protein
MKIQNLKTKVISPMLLLIPMMCGHLGDGHHTGYRQPGLSQQSHQSSTQSGGIPGMAEQEWITIRQDSTDEK